jgi:hypothetical protein
MFLEQILGEACALAAEDKGVAGAEISLEIALRSEGAEEAEARCGMAILEVAEVEVLVQVNEVPIVKAGAPDAVLVDPEAEPADEVERALRGGGETRDVACVLRDLGLNEDDVEGGLERRRP